MNALKRITVLLAEDHVVIREGLRKILDAEDGFEVVGEAGTGCQAVEMAKELHPDVVIMDIAMPRLNGLEATRQIRNTVPDAKVLILSAHGDEAYVDRVIELGASGYLIKQTSFHVLIEAIRAVHTGTEFFSPAIARDFRRRHRTTMDRKGRAKAVKLDLTSREMEVLQQIAEGAANKQIAAELGISIKTVEKHRDHLMRKLNIHDTASLTRYAIEKGIIETSVQLTIV